jgi:tetratricopeptide (TPR) repeat protein
MRPLLISLLFALPSMAANVPDYKVNVGLDPASKVPAWLLEFIPPAGHHFNLNAPMSVQTTQGAIQFKKWGAELKRVGFRSSEFKLKEGDEVSSSLFLCDEAKTYCVKKTLQFPLKVNSDLKVLEFKTSQPVKAARPIQEKKSIKDEHGFWDNDFKSALLEAKASHKPLLIDFYGIWCPPCNLYNETVFPKKKFKDLSKSFVFLKMDADDEKSFELKSQFKVGGYPTLLVLKTPESDRLESLVELDRIVGFFPIDPVTTRLKAIHELRNQSLEEKLKSDEGIFVSNLKKLIDLKVEQKADAEALSMVQKGMALNPQDFWFPVTEAQIQGRVEASKVNWSELKVRLSEIVKVKTTLDSNLLMKSADLMISNADSFKAEELKWVDLILAELERRLDPKTLMMSDIELSIADIQGMKLDLAEALKDEKNIKTARLAAIDAYLKLIALNPSLDSRGFNLELAHLYVKHGDFESAKKIYSRFIEKYPHEFTFYFAACKMYFELKDLKIARDYAERALQYSYGDNAIRSMDRLLRVMAAQGEKDFALKRGKEFLASFKTPQGLQVRTTRYMDQLKNTLLDLEKGKSPL